MNHIAAKKIETSMHAQQNWSTGDMNLLTDGFRIPSTSGRQCSGPGLRKVVAGRAKNVPGNHRYPINTPSSLFPPPGSQFLLHREVDVSKQQRKKKQIT